MNCVTIGSQFGTIERAAGAPRRFWLSTIIESIRPQSTASASSYQTVLSGEVRYQSRVFKLAKPLSLDVRFKEGVCVIEGKPLEIVAWGNSYSEALKAFALDLACSWDQLVNEDDKNLTGDAQLLKAKLRTYVQSAG